MVYSTLVTVALGAPALALAAASWTGSGLGDWARGALVAYVALGAAMAAGGMASAVGVAALLAIAPALIATALGGAPGLTVAAALWAVLLVLDQWRGEGGITLLASLFIAAALIGLARALT